ncbi:MAG: hypothetical protein RL481_2416 [Pseudomonadota bacterium]
MTREIRGPIEAMWRRHGQLQARSFELDAFGQAAAPVRVFDDFKVGGDPFAPHPHAGFSAVSYVFEDSAGRLRSRDSLGGDYVVGAGGIVWSQAAHGMMHEELPADLGQEIHGLQLFVNLGAKAKQLPARVFHADGPQVPVWRDDAGNSVRVAAGQFAGLSSPVQPAEPCDLLDLHIVTGLDYDVAEGRNAFIYCESGSCRIDAGTASVMVSSGQAMAIGGAGPIAFTAESEARIVLVSGLDLREPIVAHGPFIMNSADGIREAISRFERGEMGKLPKWNAT